MGPLSSGPGSGSMLDSFKSQIISLLNIPAHLTGSGDVPLQVAYQKYMAYLLACSTLDGMVANGTWTIKCPTRTDLIEVFVSKSFFHSHYCRWFPKVADYPEMVAWLKEEPGSKDVDVWGVKKASYTFVDLSDWLGNGGKFILDDEDEKLEKVLKRGKEKEKYLEKRKEKEKKREHKKKESSRRAK